MRALFATLLAVAAAATLAASCGAATVAVAARCAPGGAQIKVSDRRAQVYALNNAIYGCDRRTHKVTKLGVTTNCIAMSRVDHFALAGDVVGYGVETCGVDTGSTTIIVRRLSDGKQLRNLAAVKGPIGPESYESVGSLVVKPGGAVAWIATANSIVGHGTRTEVDANGKVLDSGGGIVRSSLRLNGSKLTWRDGSSTRSATL
jgi:hypothetical protein